MARRNEEIKFTVVAKLGVLSSKEYERKNWETKAVEKVTETKELRRIAWNDGTPKLEIRTWYNVGGVETCGKGITLDDDEWDTLQFLSINLEQHTA